MRTLVHLRSRATMIAAAGMLVALLALGGFASGAAAASVSTPASGTCPSGLSGLGTAASPCLIGSAADLYQAMEAINADSTHVGAAIDDYELTADIDATTFAAGTAGTATTFGATENWSGINYFSGVFDGDGHTISNLNYTTGTYTLTLPGASAPTGLNLGFFRVLNGATVKDLGLHNVRAISATANAAVGGVSVWGFDSTVSGVSLTEPTISATAGGGNSWVGGLVGLSYANAYAHETSTVSDGGATVFTDDLVSGGTIADANRTGGIAGIATGPSTVADNWVNTALSNPVHPVAGLGGQENTYFYVIGGLVGEVGTSYTTTAGATAAGVAMTDNVIQGSLEGKSPDHRSFGGANFASPTVGYATVPGHNGTSAPPAANWSSTNNLVSSAFDFNDNTGEGLPGADGISVSPATIEAESTYSGTASAQTDAATGATFDQLGWTFGGAGSSATSGWGWNGTAPVPAVAPTITVAKDPIAFLAGSAPAASVVEAEAGASTSFGTLAIEDSGVEWSKPGAYTATLSAANFGFTSSRPLTIVVTSGTVPVAHATGGLQASATAASTDEVVSALGAVLPQGDDGTLAVHYPSGEPAWDTPGNYAVEVIDTGGSDGLTPTDATIAVVAQPTVTVKNSTVSFRHGVPVTASEVIAAAEPAATYSAGDSGSFTTDISGVGTEVGEYAATITATDKYGIASAPVTVTVAVVDGKILLGHPTPVFQVTTTEPTEAAILAALAPVMPPDTTGHPTVSGYTAADFEATGTFQVTVADSNTGEEIESTTATIEVVPVATVTDTASTVYFNTAEPPTAEEVIAAAGAQVTAGGLPAPGSKLEATLPSGCATMAGNCKVTIVGTDAYGFTTAPVEVTVEVSAARVAVGQATTFFGAGSEPSQATLASRLGATVTDSTNGGQPVLDASSVRWDVAGIYPVTVGDSAAHDAAPTVQASIEIVPLPVVTVPTTTIYLPVNGSESLSEAALLANAGAELTDGSGNAVAGTLAADASAVKATHAGTYTATITGTDEFGIESAPLTITVVIYSEVPNPVEEAVLEEEVQRAEEAKQQAETALRAAETKVAEEAHQGAEATQRAEAAEKAAEAAKKSAEEAEKRAASARTNRSTGGRSGKPSVGGAAAKPKLGAVRAAAGQIHASVKVTGRGTLTATATSGNTKVGSVQAKVTTAGTVQLKLALSKAAEAQLADGNLVVTLKVSFKDASGRVSTATRTVTVKRSGG